MKKLTLLILLTMSMQAFGSVAYLENQGPYFRLGILEKVSEDGSRVLLSYSKTFYDANALKRLEDLILCEDYNKSFYSGDLKRVIARDEAGIVRTGEIHGQPCKGYYMLKFDHELLVRTGRLYSQDQIIFVEDLKF